MKAIIEVEHEIGDVYKILSKRYGERNVYLAGDEIEIIQENTMSEIKLTEEQFIEIDKYLYSNDDIDNSRTLRLVLAKQKGWIVKDEIEQAIDALKDYADTVIELLQNKIKDLEK